MDAPKSYLIDMDGVLVRGGNAIAGAAEFLARLEAREAEYLLLTNSPRHTPGDLSHRLKTIGLTVPRERIFTSALATARFLGKQRGPGGTAYVIGESGLTEALHDVGFVITDHEPEYVVLGDTTTYNFEMFTRATKFLASGAHFIATNPDASDPTEHGIAPACGALAALLERASGSTPFFVGKPNPLMMRAALNTLGVHSENTVMVGDRMDTDIIGGVQAGLETILVLTGVTRRDDVRRYSYQPSRIVDSVADIEV